MVDDEQWMQQALEEARLAALADEVPVGAVIVCEGVLIAQAHNRREGDRDPLAHAEILVLREAAKKLDRWRLSGCTLYVTLEPCVMCAGALVNARVDRLVYGATDPRAGAVGSIYDIPRDPRLNHRLAVTSGVAAQACTKLLQEFFAAKRAKRETELV